MKTHRKSLLLFATVSMACTAPAALATDLYWDTDGTGTAGSGAATGTWGTNAFWSTDSTGANIGSPVLTAATTNLDDLFFSAGTNGTGGTVTVSGSQTARKLTFQEGAITLSGGTLITLASGGISVATGAGNAVIDTALTATGAQIYDIGASRTLTANGLLTGGIIKNGSGTMILGGTLNHAISSWVVNEGILQLGGLSGDALPGGTVNNGGTVKLSGGNSRVNNNGIFTINLGGVFDLNGVTDLVGGMVGAGSIQNTAVGAASVSTNPNSGTRTFSGVIGGGGGGVMGFTLNGNGTQVLSNLNTYTGVTNIQNGTLSINSIGNVNGGASAIGNPSSVANGLISLGNNTATGTLLYTGNNQISDRTIRIGANTTTPADTNTGGATITANGADNAALIFNAPTFNTQTNATSGVGANRVLTLQGTSTGLNSISGTIRDNLVSGTATGTATIGLTKAQAGTWVLSGANTYTGKTTISGGILQFAKIASLYNSVTGNWTAANVAVASGGTLALNVGGTNEFTTGNVTTLLTNLGGANGTTTTGFAAGAGIGFDTTNAGGTFTVADNIANSTGTGGGAVGVTKIGTGNLLLTNSTNAYTGATAISGGTLRLSGSGRLNSGNYAGAITLSNSAIFEKVSSGAQVLTGAITGTGTVKLDNSNGELLLRNASNNYTALNINAGRVFIQTNSGALPAAATVSLTGGTLNFDVAGTYNNAITVSSGANISARKLTTLSNVTLPGTGTVIFNNDDAVTTTLSITNGQTLTGSLSVQIGGGGTTANAVGGVTLSGQLTGSGSLLVASTGPVNNAKHTLTLSGTNDYAGTTTVNNGTLLINGNSSTATGAIAVNNGGTLGGTGRAGGAVTVAGGATLAPGASIESLAVASLNMVASSIFAYEISNNTATGADLLAVGSTVALTDVTLSLDSASLAALSGGGWNIGDKLTLLSYLGADITSGFTGYDDDTDYTFATNIWLFNYNDTEAGDNYGADAIAGGQNRFVTMTLIPEPNVAALLGACGILVLLRRRN